MADLRPDRELFAAMLLVAVRQAALLPARADEAPLHRLRGRVSAAHGRLVASYGRAGRGPTPADDTSWLSERALELAAALVRGLDDCREAGVLTGYGAIAADRTPEPLLRRPPRATRMEAPRADPPVDGWMLETSRHVAALGRDDADPETVTREAFAALGAATALAAVLAGRLRRR